MKLIDMVVENTRMHAKIITKLTNFRLNHELISIMMNKHRIYEDLGKIFRYSSNSIKLNDEIS